MTVNEPSPQKPMSSNHYGSPDQPQHSRNVSGKKQRTLISTSPGQGRGSIKINLQKSFTGFVLNPTDQSLEGSPKLKT